MKKYVIEFLAIFLAISLSYLVEEWREDKQNRAETKNALELIRMDTNYYKLRINRLLGYADVLEKGIDGKVEDLDELKGVLMGLRGNADYEVQKYGINYLRNNIRLPKMKNDTLLIQIGHYYDLSSPTGNYGLFGIEHFKMTSENYYNSFTAFPRYLDQDSSIANQALRDGMDVFMNDPYWQGRVNLAYREASRSMQYVYEKNLRFAEDILRQIELELDENVDSYTVDEKK